MPSRKYIFTNQLFYHIYNKSIDQKRIFLDESVSQYFLKVAHFYSYRIPSGVSFSGYRRMNSEDRSAFFNLHIKKENKQIIFNAFSLMPNHFHFLVQQKCNNGIVSSMTKTMDSITRYYNIKNRRKGPIFLPHFNAVPIVSKQQLMYVSKYIHLNPLRAGIVKSYNELTHYKYSSLIEYTSTVNRIYWINTKKILKHFNFSKDEYWKYLIGNRE